MEYARISERGVGLTSIPARMSESQRSKMLSSILKCGFLPVEDEGAPDEASLGAIESYEPRYRQEDGRIVRYYEKVAVDIVKVAAEIERLKAELAATDYQVTKNQELQMLGLACQYDPHELHAQREPLREAIRELEGYLA